MIFEKNWRKKKKIMKPQVIEYKLKCINKDIEELEENLQHLYNKKQKLHQELSKQYFNLNHLEVFD